MLLLLAQLMQAVATELAVSVGVRHPCIVQVHAYYTGVVLACRDDAELAPAQHGQTLYRLLSINDPGLPDTRERAREGGCCILGQA